MIKLNTFTKVIIFYLIICLKVYADDSKPLNNKITIGPYDAAVKVQVFSSLTCPHCANFHINVIPKIKKEYVNSGKVQLIFIDFPLDQAAFNASKLLHCLDQKKQMDFLDIIYQTQNKWTNGSNLNDINENLKKIVENLGISSSQFDNCLVDEGISNKILSERIDANHKYVIESTPTIVINEKKLEGSATFKNIKKKIEKLI